MPSLSHGLVVSCDAQINTHTHKIKNNISAPRTPQLRRSAAGARARGGPRRTWHNRACAARGTQHCWGANAWGELRRHRYGSVQQPWAAGGPGNQTLQATWQAEAASGPHLRHARVLLSPGPTRLAPSLETGKQAQAVPPNARTCGCPSPTIF